MCVVPTDADHAGRQASQHYLLQKKAELLSSSEKNFREKQKYGQSSYIPRQHDSTETISLQVRIENVEGLAVLAHKVPVLDHFRTATSRRKMEIMVKPETR